MFRLRARLAVAANRAGLPHLLRSACARLPLSWQRLTVMTWHRVGNGLGAGFDRGVVDASPEQLDRQVAVLKQYFSIIDIAALVKYREERRPLPPNPALLTFDDGYRDSLTVALPILKKHRVSAVFFIPTGFIGTHRLFSWELISATIARCRRPSIRISYPQPLSFFLDDDLARLRVSRQLSNLSRSQVHLDWNLFLTGLAEACEVHWDANAEREIADALILDWDGVRALTEAGMDVQSHGDSHLLYRSMDAEEALRDASTARHVLEAQTGVSPVAIAYPAGAGFPPEAPGYRAVEKAGYKLGFCLDMRSRRLGSISDWLNLSRLSSELGMTEEHFRGLLAFPNILS